jgi:hypothetical protein
MIGAGVRAERDVVVEGFPYVFWFKPQGRATVGPTDRSFPQVEVAEDFLDDRVLFYERDQAHLAAAFGAQERINVPGALDQFAPGFRWDAATNRHTARRRSLYGCAVFVITRAEARDYGRRLPSALAARLAL